MKLYADSVSITLAALEDALKTDGFPRRIVATKENLELTFDWYDHLPAYLMGYIQYPLGKKGIPRVRALQPIDKTDVLLIISEHLK